ncbi:MAG: hypothetical protein M0P61_08850 [Ignavibacteriaceae bacterium]|jgi:uncharacterized low-complexity protein|nr:hypothetical protein [Ignavibacteriaceae bacterium]
MNKQQNQLAKHIFLTGSFIAGSVFGLGAATTTNAESLFGFRSLGSGAELRSSLLESSTNRNLELKCGSKTESSETKTADAKCGSKTSEAKAKDAKCGSKTDSTAKASETKAKDAKCGEGKCGSSKTTKKHTTTATTPKKK